jgi:hypothetical protein
VHSTWSIKSISDAPGRGNRSYFLGCQRRRLFEPKRSHSIVAKFVGITFGALILERTFVLYHPQREQKRRSFFHGKVLHCTRRSAADDHSTSTVLHFGVPCIHEEEKRLSTDRENPHSLVPVDRMREPRYPPLMKQLITAKLKLHTTPAQFQALRATQLAYRDALNHVSRYAYEHGKMSSGRALQRDCYDEIRRVYQIPAQMACNVPRQVGATYKTLWTKVRQNTALRKAGKTKKRYKGLDSPPKYVSPTITYNYHRDYSLKEEAQVSILTLSGRVIVAYTGYSKHRAAVAAGAHIGAAKLWYDKPHKQFYLLVTLEVAVRDPTPQDHTHVVGVDVGQRYLAVSTDTEHHSHFYSGKAVHATANHYARLRKRLQKKALVPPHDD